MALQGGKERHRRKSLQLLFRPSITEDDRLHPAEWPVYGRAVEQSECIAAAGFARRYHPIKPAVARLLMHQFWSIRILQTGRHRLTGNAPPGDLYFGSAKTKDIARTYVRFRHAISGQVFPKQAGAEALPGLRGISLTPEIVMFPGIMHERAIGILKMFPDAVLGFQSMRIEIHAAA